MATHYGTLDDAATYHDERGNAPWAASTDPQRTSALVRASEALDGIYSSRFPGKKASRSQDRAWPRIGAIDHCANEAIPDDETPAEIQAATYALAIAELTSPGASTPTLTMGRITKREKADVLEREFMTAADGVAISPETLRPVLTAVEDALRCLLMPDGGKGGTYFLDRA